MYPRVKEVIVPTDYQLLIVFTNNEQKVFDAKPYLNIGVFKKLKNTSIFNSVRIVDGTVRWSNDLEWNKGFNTKNRIAKEGFCF
jgi:hypothetical protein